MPRRFQLYTSWQRALALAVLAAGSIGSWALLIAQAYAKTDSPTSSGQPGPTWAAAAIAGSAAVSKGALPANGEPPLTEDPPRPSRPLKLRRFAGTARGGGSDAWYMGMGGIALVLAVCGGLAVAARRFLPQGESGGLQIISRVSLSPKHSVYMLRAGRRVLLVGAGPQGAPSLISELDDLPENAPSVLQGEDP